MKKLLLVSLSVAAGLAPCAYADTITFTTSQYEAGTGFGNVTNVLSLHATPSEAGSVLWNGTSEVETGDAANTSKVWTAAELALRGFTDDNLGIIFNPAEPGAAGQPPIDLLSFSLDFYTSAGVLIGHAFLTNPTNGVIPISSGTGTAGYRLTYANTGLLTTFFSDPTNVLGGTGSLGQSAGGQDNFYLARTDVIPEPGTLLLLGAGLTGLVARRRRR